MIWIVPIALVFAGYLLPALAVSFLLILLERPYG